VKRMFNGRGHRRPRHAVAVVLAAALIAPGAGCVWRRPPRTTTTTATTTTTTTTSTATTTTTTTTGPPATGSAWASWGRDLGNSHHQPTETAISPATVGQLAPKWVAQLKGDVSATPTVVDGVAYVPDWGGYLTAVDTRDGSIIWQRPVTDYVVFGGVVSRTSPAVVGDDLVLGFTTRLSNNPLGGPPPATGPVNPGNPYQGAYVARVNRARGDLVWQRKVEAQAYAQITSNPVVHDGRVIVGVSSNEWNLSGVSQATCCTFRGSVVSLDADDGTVQWQAYTIPESKAGACNPRLGLEAYSGCGYSGAAVWSSPAVDTTRGLVYVGTGQNYTVPDPVRPCITQARAEGRPDSDCADPDNHTDSLLAFELATGRLRWAKQLLPFDPWHMGCVLTPGWASCPAPFGPDHDLGSSPNLYTATIDGRSRDIVGSGQKSGSYWALDRETGEIIWHRVVGPGSRLGGIEWGTAYDGRRIYAPIANIEGTAYTGPDGTALRAGSWAGIDPATGTVDWQTGDPGAYPNWVLGSPAVANGVVYGASMSGSGNNFYALDATTGAILWRFASGASSIASPAIVDGVVYWGTGYDRVNLGSTGGEKLYAFSIGGR
jgi:polyvinyl alcohol dehydrogenase (cytochrome)